MHGLTVNAKAGLSREVHPKNARVGVGPGVRDDPVPQHSPEMAPREAGFRRSIRKGERLQVSSSQPFLDLARRFLPNVRGGFCAREPPGRIRVLAELLRKPCKW